MTEIINITEKDIKQFDKDWVSFDREIGIEWKSQKLSLGALHNRELIGYVSLKITGGVGYISEVIVREKHRKIGIGRALIERAEQECKKRNCHKITLKTTEKHVAGLQLYKRMNYSIEAELLEDKFKFTWYLMSKELV